MKFKNKKWKNTKTKIKKIDESKITTNVLEVGNVKFNYTNVSDLSDIVILYASKLNLYQSTFGRRHLPKQKTNSKMPDKYPCFSVVQLMSCMLDPLPNVDVFQFESIKYASLDSDENKEFYKQVSSELKHLIVRKCFKICYYNYVGLIKTSSEDEIRVYDRVLLQLFCQAESDDFFKIIKSKQLMEFCYLNLSTQVEHCVALTFPLLYINYTKQKQLPEKHYGIILRLKRLLKFLESQNLYSSEVTKWISRQAAVCLKLMGEDQCEGYTKLVERLSKVSALLAENNHSKALQELYDAVLSVPLRSFGFPDSGLIDTTLSYFLETNSNLERASRAKSFLQKILTGSVDTTIDCCNIDTRVFKTVVKQLGECFEILLKGAVMVDIEEISKNHRYELCEFSFCTSYISVKKSTDNNGNTLVYRIEPNNENISNFKLHSERATDIGDDVSSIPNSCFYDDLVRVTHLQSILHSLNNQWGELMWAKRLNPLISNDLFQCTYLSHIHLVTQYWTNDDCSDQDSSPWWFKEIVKKCPFFVRTEGKRMIISPPPMLGTRMSEKSVIYTVDRENVLEKLKTILKSDESASEYWDFEFSDEEGRGEGVTKEFYSIVSKELRNTGSNLWLGETKATNGQVLLPNEFYPSPLRASEETTQISEHFFMIGQLMAKLIQDHQMLDVPFSRVFLKWLINSNEDTEIIGISELKEVCPDLIKFLTTLEQVVSEKRRIRSNPKISVEEADEAVSNLTFDGSPFKNLLIDFTLPGYHDIEMKEGGQNIALSPHNVEEYMHLLAFWFLREGPKVKLQAFKEGFDSVMSTSLLSILDPAELQSVICGEGYQAWTKDELSKKCRVDKGYSLKSQTIKFLFEILSQFGAEEQKEFLHFTTSSSKLPVGGLQLLDPRLTIHLINYDNPDLYLPSSSTCFNTLMLPNYSSLQITKEKLLYAMKEGWNSFLLV